MYQSRTQHIISIILSNTIPLIGVFVAGWDPLSVFGLFIIETIIIGLLHAGTLHYVLKYDIADKTPSQTPKGGNQLPPNPVFMPLFFLFHFMFFVFVQTIIVFSSTDPSDSFFSGITKLLSFAQGEYLFVVVGFLVINVLETGNELLIQDTYKDKPIDKIFMEPYPRIFLQQFVVILGGITVAITGGGMVLMLIFVILKTIGELALFTGAIEFSILPQKDDFE